LFVLAAETRIEKSDKFMGEPTKGGVFGPEMLTTATKKGLPPLDFKEGFGKLKEGLRKA
jgi:hypothetical protein